MCSGPILMNRNSTRRSRPTGRASAGLEVGNETKTARGRHRRAAADRGARHPAAGRRVDPDRSDRGCRRVGAAAHGGQARDAARLWADDADGCPDRGIHLYGRLVDGGR